MALLGIDTEVKGPFGATLFLLETFSGTEALGGLFAYQLTLLSKKDNIPINDVLGQEVSVGITLPNDEKRWFHGVATRFMKVGITMGHIRYTLTLEPPIATLRYTNNCRVFEIAEHPGQTALTIIKEILEDHKLPNVIKDPLKDHTFPARALRIQYRESDLAFILRLIEEEGLYYYFRHGDGVCDLMLANDGTSHTMRKGYESVPYAAKQQAQNQGEEHFWEMNVSGALYPGKHTILRGYDPTAKRPSTPLVKFEESGEPLPGHDFEYYDYPGAMSAEDEAGHEAKVRMHADHANTMVVHTRGNTMGLGVGDLLGLKTPPWQDQGGDEDKKYLVVEARYTMKIAQHEGGDASAVDEPFEASYVLQDNDVPYRSLRRVKKPVMRGPQTGVVVGPEDQEIWTDKEGLGRVLVQFDWDRRPLTQDMEPQRKNSVCWVRVSQVWAGAQWGAMFLPRIGHEVIVDFLDGDPDRPIVTGRVYNEDNKPPYKLPDNQTQSGIKSRSTKKGTDQNFNEIRFEDLKGKEEFHIQAERDMSTNVKRNQSTSVGADRSVSVGGNHSVSVTGTQSTTVTKDETQTYKANRVMKVTGTNLDEITDTHTAHYNNTRTETVKAPDDLTVNGGNKTVTVHGIYNNTVDTEFNVKKGETSLTITSDVVVNATGKYDIHNPGTSIKGEGTTLALSGNSKVTIACGSASISLSSDGTIEITGVKVKIGNTSNNAAFEPAGTTINGVKITSAAVGIHELAGALIKIG